jgi:hypothetical protein
MSAKEEQEIKFAASNPFIISVNPFMRVESSWSDNLSKMPPLNTVALGIKFPAHGLWKHIQTVAVHLANSCTFHPNSFKVNKF